jgi:hypothetical protein
VRLRAQRRSSVFYAAQGPDCVELLQPEFKFCSDCFLTAVAATAKCVLRAVPMRGKRQTLESNRETVMRTFVTSLTALTLLVLASTLAATTLGRADTVINVCGKFSFWVPDGWRETKESLKNAERSIFESADATLYVVVGPLPDKFADLSDDDVPDFASEQFSEVKVWSDTRDKLENFHVRLGPVFS